MLSRAHFYDRVYDLSPLGFEKNITNNVKKVEVQDLLEKFYVACPIYVNKLLPDDFKKN